MLRELLMVLAIALIFIGTDLLIFCLDCKDLDEEKQTEIMKNIAIFRIINEKGKL